MSLKPDDIKKVGHLARLAVSDTDSKALANDLSNILSLVEAMDAVDTNKVQPLAHPYDEKQPMRDDTVTEANQREDFQRIAPQTEAGLYIVPQVIDSE